MTEFTDTQLVATVLGTWALGIFLGVLLVTLDDHHYPRPLLQVVGTSVVIFAALIAAVHFTR